MTNGQEDNLGLDMLEVGLMARAGLSLPLNCCLALSKDQEDRTSALPPRT